MKYVLYRPLGLAFTMTTFLSILIFSLTALLSDITQRTATFTRYSPPPAPPETCPHCGSRHLIKNGSIHNGKPKQACKDCGNQFVNTPQNIKVSSVMKQLIDKLLLERISLRGIARVTGVSWDWLNNMSITRWTLSKSRSRFQTKLKDA